MIGRWALGAGRWARGAGREALGSMDLNLLITLNAVLTEGSVVGAARKLHLSPSAMSRALARLRRVMGDPLLVRAGRGLVPTPRALELRDRVSQLVWDAEGVLRPAELLDLARLERTFTLRNRDGFVENFGPRLIARVAKEAPGVRLRFIEKTDRESTLLREGAVDLETGVVAETTSPELRAQALFRDRFTGVVRKGHPLSKGRITAARFAKGRHILVSRRAHDKGAVDDALHAVGLERTIAAIVGSYSAALALARSSDLIATLPERYTGLLRSGMFSFRLPLTMPEITISLMWHPRLDADPAHRWLRQCVREVVAAAV